MKVKFFGYNTFLIETGKHKIAIDPGALFLYYFRLTTLIPEEEWQDITHIFVTHGDPDHYWHADRVAKASGAPVICNRTMVRDVDGRSLALGPRDKGLTFTTEFPDLHALDVKETIKIDGMLVTGIKATHGELVLKIGPFAKTVVPGPEERVGWGAIGFMIEVDGKTVVNMGDTLLEAEEWRLIDKPDVLMVPIGGRVVHNTMDEKEALEAVKIMKPKVVIPCHYNLPAFFTRKYCPADDKAFKREVERAGSSCIIMHEGDAVEI
jgi:L-ascorbate metabolism protein UlaG (beta-lactamase superfamily)